MIRSLLLPFIIMLPLSVSADAVAIRSGEHDTFTRLVFSIQEEMDWKIEEIESGFRLTLEGEGDGFDTSEVFERIPKSRIIDLEQVSGGVLDLQLTCDCIVETFMWRSDRLVLDISERPEPVPLDESPLYVDVAEVQVERESLPDVTIFKNGLSLTDFHMNAVEGEHEHVEMLNPEAMENVSLSEASLLDGIARAATQGFLTPNVDVFPVETPTTEPVLEAPSEAVPMEGFMTLPEITGPGVDISTAFDRNLAGIEGALRGSTEQRCLHDDLFDIVSWGDERAFHEQVAALSEALAGEFGEEPVEAETDLAKVYLHYGFGAEALAVLSITPSVSQARQVLFELAGMFEDAETGVPLLASQKNCETAGALWAFLADPEAPDTDDQINRITRSFFELPKPLRGHIAPRLSQSFLELEMPETAEFVLRAAENQDAESAPAVQTTRALIAEQSDDPDAALLLLSDQANDDARITPEAAIRLVELSLEQEEVPMESDLLLLSALAQEFDGYEIASLLADTEARGTSARGEYSRALDIIAGRTDTSAIQVKDEIYFELTENAPVSDFLVLVISTRPSDLSPSTENSIARRLIDLGFPNYALEYLAGNASSDDAAERRYLKAEAMLESGNFEQTILTLQGMNDERSRSLLADAYSGLGEYQNALEAMEDTEAISAVDLQFRAEAWDRLSTQEDTVLADFARTVVAETNVDEVETLADRRSLLSQSQESRRAVEELLLRFDGAAQQVE